MKKLGLLFILPLVLCGCTAPRALMSTRKVIQDDMHNHLSEYIFCIDGIEYIGYSNGYRGYLAPHLQANYDDSPKVVRCNK